jgi:hypothetical protein
MMSPLYALELTLNIPDLFETGGEHLALSYYDKSRHQGYHLGMAGVNVGEGVLALTPLRGFGKVAAGTEAAPLFAARDEAVRVTNKLMSQEFNAGHITEEQLPQRYGIVADAIFKANVRQAIAEGTLPSTFVTSPTVRLNRGFTKAWFQATDVWDTATGRSWDLMVPKTSTFYEHELKYLGKTMPDGTVITEINPIFYSWP